MPNSDKLLAEFLKNQEEFKDYQDSRVSSRINEQFSLSNFTDIHLTQSNLERDAKKGDPFSLAMLAKIYYDRGGAYNKSIAFNYFDAAVKKGNHYLANAIANYVTELENKRKYHRRAIEISQKECCSTWELEKLKDGYFHRKIIELTLDQKLKNSTTYSARTDPKTGGYDRYNPYLTQFEIKHRGVVKKFINFSRNSPESFKELCITCSRQQVENALEEKSMADAYFKQFQLELADKVLTAQKKAKYKKTSQDSIIKEFANAYHPDYLVGLSGVIEEREKEIENISEHSLYEMKGLVLTKMKELLSDMQMHLGEYSEDQEENEDALTVEEIKLLDRLLRIPADSTSLEQTENSSEKLIPLIANDSNIRNIYLQLKAFRDVGEKLGIALDNFLFQPSAPTMHESADHESSPSKPSQSDSKETEHPNTQKLHDIVVVIQNAHSNLERQSKSQIKPFKWIEFIKVVLAACSLVGIGFMVHSSRVYDTHKFWNSQKQTESKALKIKKQAAIKAKKSLFQVVGHHAEKATNELPSLKVASGHRRVGKG